MKSPETWPTSTPPDYEQAERYAIQHEDDPLPGPVARHWFMWALIRPGDGWMDLRAIRPGRVPRQEWAAAGDMTAVEAFVQKYGADHDLYVGVASRRTRESGRLANCGVLRVFFCDIDFKETPESEAIEHLATSTIPAPPIEVRSGGGLHWYWPLRTPIDLRDPEQLEEARSRLRGIAEHLGGDIKSAEPARVLRLPATRNYKYDPPREVHLASV
jgi:hypothetical protein